MLEAATALGRRMMSEPEPVSGIEKGFRLCTGRKPNPPEAQRLYQLLGELRIHYEKQPTQAVKLGGDAPRAAWTLLGNVLLNLDETITKE